MRLSPGTGKRPTEGLAALLFDLDGTLVDSEAPGLEVLHAEACRLGVDFTLSEAHAQFRGGRMADCVAFIRARATERAWADAPDFDASFTRHLRTRMAERFRQGLDTIPGATQLLARLSLPCAIATNGPREKAELTLGLTGLLPRFEGRLFCAYEVGSFKPDPGLFLHAAQQLRVAPGACGVVEDSLPGLRAGLTAGMTVFSLAPAAQVLDGLGTDLASQIHFIDDLHALDRWLHD